MTEQCYICEKEYPSSQMVPHKFDTFMCSKCADIPANMSYCDGCLTPKQDDTISYYFDGDHELCDECWKLYREREKLEGKEIERERKEWEEREREREKEEKDE